MTTAIAETTTKTSLLAKMAGKFGVAPDKMLATLKATAFKVKDGEATNEQLMALLIVSDQYGLNPWTKEIYAFPDKQNGIVPVVGVDGWARIINEHPQCDGIEFREAENAPGGIPEWIECTLYRKDRAHAIRVKEYFAECRRDVSPWRSHPRRMLRHKALIQCARLAFGFVGIYDEDEAARIVDATSEPAKPSAASSAVKAAADKIVAKAKKPTPIPPAEPVVVEAEPVVVEPQAADEPEMGDAAEPPMVETIEATIRATRGARSLGKIRDGLATHVEAAAITEAEAEYLRVLIDERIGSEAAV